MPSGGDLKECTFKHPTLGFYRFFPKAGSDSKYTLGGYKTDDSDTNIDGSGAFINSMQQMPWSFELQSAWDMNDPKRQELESTLLINSSVLLGDATFTLINGITYAGNGKIVGTVTGSGKDCTIDLKFMGGGILQQI